MAKSPDTTTIKAQGEVEEARKAETLERHVKAGRADVRKAETSEARSMVTVASALASAGSHVHLSGLSARGFAIAAEHGDRATFQAWCAETGKSQPVRLATYTRAVTLFKAFEGRDVAADVGTYVSEARERDDSPTLVGLVTWCTNGRAFGQTSEARKASKARFNARRIAATVAKSVGNNPDRMVKVASALLKQAQTLKEEASQGK